MFNLIHEGLKLQAASINQYHRIASINESTGDLVMEAQANNAILQRKGKSLVICSRLLSGYRQVQISFKPDSPEAA